MLSWIWTKFDQIVVYADAHGSGLAALAALIGIPLLLWQILQGTFQDRKKAKARRYAGLATLPITLSGVNLWAKQAAKALSDIYPWVMGSRGGNAPEFHPPASPDNLIEAIERMIEAAPGDRVGKTLAAIVSDMQVLNARIGDPVEYRANNLRTHSGMIDSNLFLTARIYARAESLYDLSRSLSDDAPLDFSRVQSALNLMDIRDLARKPDLAALPTAHELVERAIAKKRNERSQIKKGWDWLTEKWEARRMNKRNAEIADRMRAQREAQKNEQEDGDTTDN